MTLNKYYDDNTRIIAYFLLIIPDERKWGQIWFNIDILVSHSFRLSFRLNGFSNQYSKESDFAYHFY
jgi:hypothetical protein